MKEKVLDAIVWLGVDGFGSRWKSAVLLEGLLINQTMMIEPIDEQKKIWPLLLTFKTLIGDNDLITIHRMQVVWPSFSSVFTFCKACG